MLCRLFSIKKTSIKIFLQQLSLIKLQMEISEDMQHIKMFQRIIINPIESSGVISQTMVNCQRRIQKSSMAKSLIKKDQFRLTQQITISACSRISYSSIKVNQMVQLNVYKELTILI